MNLNELVSKSHESGTQIARKLGYSAKTVSDWIHGRARPSSDAAKQLAKILNVTPEEILKCFKAY